MSVARGVAVVTGSSGGIGQALVQRLILEGFDVIGLDRVPGNLSDVEHITTNLRELADSEESQLSLREQIVSLLGPRNLVSLINLAAIQHVGDLRSQSIEHYTEALAVNALAPLVLVRLLFPELAQNRGTVMNVSSIHAEQSKRLFSAYSISKAALSALSRSLSIELGKEIRTIEIRPAAIATPMLEAGFDGKPEERARLDQFHPTGKIGQPEDVAELCALVLRNPAAFLNGSVINLDGGISHLLHDPE